MRYVVAIVFAAIAAAGAAVFVSSDVADWAVNRMAFESPDEADSMHMLVYMASNVAGIILGWLVGWVIAGSGGAARPGDAGPPSNQA